MKTSYSVGLLSTSLALALSACNLPGPAPLGQPAPILFMTGQEYYSAGGKNFVRYQYDVLNKDQYPADLFAAAPTLPPCGLNNNSSRTWVHFFDRNGTRIYGFCALGSTADLGLIWFAVEEGTVPPSWVYIEMEDRQANIKYKSNEAETTL